MQSNVQFVFNLPYHKTHIWYTTQIKAEAQARTLCLFCCCFVCFCSCYLRFRGFLMSYYFTWLTCLEMLLLYCSTCSSSFHCLSHIYRNPFMRLAAQRAYLPYCSQAVERAEHCSVSQWHWSLGEDHCDRWFFQPSWSQMRAEGRPSFFTEFLLLSPWLSEMAFHILSLSLVTLHLVRKADVLHEGAVTDGSLMQWGCTLACPFTVHHTIVAASHKHVPLLRAADRSRAFCDVWEMRQPRNVV